MEEVKKKQEDKEKRQKESEQKQEAIHTKQTSMRIRDGESYIEESFHKELKKNGIDPNEM